MGRAYEDSVYVRVAAARGGEGGSAVEPEAFVWRERLYVVREVLGSWCSPVPWWQGRAARALRGESPGGGGRLGVVGSSALASSPGGPAVDERVWRVSASVGYAADPGTYDLVREPGGQRWRLAKVVD